MITCDDLTDFANIITLISSPCKFKNVTLFLNFIYVVLKVVIQLLGFIDNNKGSANNYVKVFLLNYCN